MYFHFDNEIDLIALYAAILSTVIGVWEFIKWRKKHAIKMVCTANMLLIPSRDKKKYLIARVTNRGETPTTITHLLACYWPSRWHQFSKKKQQNFIVNCLNVPAVLQPGEVWIGQAEQDEKIEQMAQDGYLYMGIAHSMKDKEILQRVKITGDKSKTKQS